MQCPRSSMPRTAGRQVVSSTAPCVANVQNPVSVCSRAGTHGRQRLTSNPNLMSIEDSIGSGCWGAKTAATVSAIAPASTCHASQKTTGVHLQQGGRQLDGGRTEACYSKHFEHRVPAEAVRQEASWQGCQWHTNALNALDKADKLHDKGVRPGLGEAGSSFLDTRWYSVIYRVALVLKVVNVVASRAW